MRRSGTRPGVGFVGHYDRDYPRNACIRRLITELGYDVVECHSAAGFPLRHLVLAAKILSARERFDVIWVAEGGHRLVPLLKLVARVCRRRLVFDPFTSRYNTRVEDRRLFRAGGLRAWIASWQDWSSCSAADHLVFDTAEHERYFRDRYRLSTPGSVLEVAVDENVFAPASVPCKSPGLRVLFYGTYVPLQGVHVIAKAAARLRDRVDVQFTLIGRGQEFPAVARMVRDLGNVTLLHPVPPRELSTRIARAHVCLGIFADTSKAARVVPNKVVQCAAQAKAIITRRSAAIERYFSSGRSILAVDPEDDAALADAIVRLGNDGELRTRLGRHARAVFEGHFSAAALRPKLARILAA